MLGYRNEQGEWDFSVKAFTLQWGDEAIGKQSKAVVD